MGTSMRTMTTAVIDRNPVKETGKWYRPKRSVNQRNNVESRYHFLKLDGVSLCCKWTTEDMEIERVAGSETFTKCRTCLERLIRHLRVTQEGPKKRGRPYKII